MHFYAPMSSVSIVLIADDEHPITELLTDILSEEGYSVEVFHDGASALMAIRSQRPDVVILDNAMPVMTGQEVLQTLRAEGFTKLPIIMATAGLNPERFLVEGATAVVAKPFDIHELLDTVARTLSE